MSLRECPFCGGDASMPAPRTGQLPITIIAICSRCYASVARTNEAAALAAWNRRAPSAEETRLRAEIASLRVTLGRQSATEGAEPIGCPIPGMCSAVTAAATGYREGAEAMREAVIKRIGHDWFSAADIVRALPLPEPPK